MADTITVLTEDTPQIITTGIVGPQGPAGEAGGIQWKGAWDIATAYVTHDVVTYLGDTWIAEADNTGKVPGVDPEWDSFVSVGDIDGGTL